MPDQVKRVRSPGVGATELIGDGLPLGSPPARPAPGPWRRHRGAPRAQVLQPPGPLEATALLVRELVRISQPAQAACPCSDWSCDTRCALCVGLLVAKSQKVPAGGESVRVVGP
jgi:hypothetical protein